MRRNPKEPDRIKPAKLTFIYNHERREWDYIIRDFMGISGLNVVTPPSSKYYPLEARALT